MMEQTMHYRVTEVSDLPITDASKKTGSVDSGPNSSRTRASRTAIWLGIALIAALALRVWWLKEKVTVIEGEGANYARMAENIATGKGWIGTQGHLQLFYPPLYPLLIAGGYYFVHDAELAARIVSICFGTLLVLPVFFITRNFYDQRIAFFAALLVALHPMFVGVSAEVYSESLYLCLLFAGVWYGMRAGNEQSFAKAVLAGGLFGLAYLTRTEVLLTAALFVAFILWSGRRNWSKAIRVSASLILAGAIVGAPYVWFLKAKSGQFRIEAKSADNFTYGQMRLAGIPWEQAFREIDDNLNPVGLSMRSELDVLKSTKFSFPTALRFIKLAAHDNGRYAVRDLLEEKAVGGFVLVALVTLALFGQPWNRKRAVREAMVIVFLVLLFVPLLTLVTYWNSRYILAFLIVLLIWSAKGAANLAEWSSNTFANALSGRPLKEWIRNGIATVAVAVLLAVTWPAAHHVENLRSGDPALKTAGLFLKGRLSNGMMVMDTDNLVAYYSGGVYRPFPYSSQQIALRYIEANNVNVLVIREKNAETSNPYYESWISKGVPDSAFTLTATLPSQEYGRIFLYERNDSAPISRN